MEKVIAAFDIGAGSKDLKLGIFDEFDKIEYGEFDFSHIDDSDNLAKFIAEKITDWGHEIQAFAGSTPGIFRSDGSYVLAAHLGFLDDTNLRDKIAQELNLDPKYGAIINDGDAGGLGLWSLLKIRFGYLAIGGDLGGAFVSEEGRIEYPSTDWDRNDSNLHFSNEPGYSIPLFKDDTQYIVEHYGGNYNLLGIDDLLGPSDDTDSVRAGALISGPGIVRIFHSVAGIEKLPKEIDQLAEDNIKEGVNTYKIFGNLMGEVCQTILECSCTDMDFYIGGKPSAAVKYFKEEAESKINKYNSSIHQSPIEKRGGNANLTGAALLANRIKNEQRRIEKVL
ncbi:MAG: hypothetical protein V3V78_04575 [Candidatus Woesearchaeota archaeon]